MTLESNDSGHVRAHESSIHANPNAFSAMMLRFLVVVASLLAIEAFTAPKAATKSWALSMAPKYDKVVGKWSVTNPATEGPEAGYGIGKTLLLRGPKPFFHRLFQPDDYEQAVLKFMAGEKCSRIEAQGNMDAYLESKWSPGRIIR